MPVRGRKTLFKRVLQERVLRWAWLSQEAYNSVVSSVGTGCVSIPTTDSRHSHYCREKPRTVNPRLTASVGSAALSEMMCKETFYHRLRGIDESFFLGHLIQMLTEQLSRALFGDLCRGHCPFPSPPCPSSGLGRPRSPSFSMGLRVLVVHMNPEVRALSNQLLLAVVGASA